ncbi:MAG: cytochrome P450 [Caldilineaceae bacterium]|nr:cytochrome P450 [Caldilineaceae bacterium]
MLQFDPRAPEFRRNPYPFYDTLRANAPVLFWETWGVYFLTRWEDCNRLLRDSRMGHGGMGEPPPQQRDLYRMQINWMLFRDPPDHTRLRGLAQRAFTPRMVEQMRAAIQDITDSLLDRVAAKGELDVMADLAYPLPVTVIARLLGVPEADVDTFHAWSDALGRSLDLTEEEEVYNEASRAAAAFTAFLADLADRRRVEPTDDLLSALVAAEEEGDHLTTDELYATCALLLVAGHETTVNLIGNGTLALLRNPAQLALLRADPSLTRSAVEELLRYDSPVQLTSRIVLAEVDVDGQRIPPGMQLSFMLGAANHDPAVFTDPHTLDIARKPNPHLAFGSGIHYCLGAPLARLEAQIAFDTLLRRFATLALLDDNPPHRDNYLLRGLERLPVGF